MKEWIRKYHIGLLTLALAHVFTYANVDLPFVEVMLHPDYLVSFTLNALQIYLLIRLCYYVAVEKPWSGVKGILTLISVFLALRLIEIWLFDFDEADYTELYTITLPFGILILVGFYLYYVHIYRPQVIPLEEKKEIWLTAVSGKRKVDLDKLLYAQLHHGVLKVYLESESFAVDMSLKEFEDKISACLKVLRLNRQVICTPKAIQSFSSAVDGRLEVKFVDSNTVFISKNKAAQMKKDLTSSHSNSSSMIESSF